MTDAEHPTTCPKCGGELYCGYGLACGEPGVYWACLEDGCDWMGPKPQRTVCFPHGICEPEGA